MNRIKSTPRVEPAASHTTSPVAAETPAAAGTPAAPGDVVVPSFVQRASAPAPIPSPAPPQSGRQITKSGDTSVRGIARATYTLTAPVGPGCSNRPQDVEWVRWRLFLQINPDTGRPYLPFFDPSHKSLDAATADALALFQRQRTKARDGRADPRGKTHETLAQSPAMRLDASVGRGGKNDPKDVARVQQALVTQGLLVPGRFTLGSIDPKNRADPTLVAILLFQKTYTHGSDGRIDVGAETHHQLKRVSPQPQIHDLGLSGPIGRVSTKTEQRSADVFAVQLRLVHHGVLDFDDFTPGVMNEASVNAVESFQKRFMKKADGTVDPGRRTEKLLALDRHEMDVRFPRPGPRVGDAVDARGDVIDRAVDPEDFVAAARVSLPAATAAPAGIGAGFHLEAFPVTGGRFNIGYDHDWKSFDHPEHNSDYYLTAGINHAEGHHGVDVFAPRGTPLVAPVSGTLVRVVKNDIGNGGRRVAIRRGNETFYLAHLDSVNAGLKEGAQVKAGTQIGTLGDSGNARGTAPHLHFSCYRGNNYTNSEDPFPFLIEALEAKKSDG